METYHKNMTRHRILSLQREGRILRQGNANKEVRIFRYVTKGSFDSFNWNTVENKARFISQIMDSRELCEREHEDISEDVMKYSQMVAASSNNPLFLERLEVEGEIRKLELLRRSFLEQKKEIKHLIETTYPEKIEKLKHNIEVMKKDEKLAEAETGEFSIKIKERLYTERAEAGAAIMAMLSDADKLYMEQKVGEYRGFSVSCKTDLNEMDTRLRKGISVSGPGMLTYFADVTESTEKGICMRIDNLINKIGMRRKEAESRLENEISSFESAKEDYLKEFSEEGRLEELKARKMEIETELLRIEEESEKEEKETLEEAAVCVMGPGIKK